MGSVYRPKLKDWRTRPANDQRSAVWWCKYYVNGRPVRESTGTDSYEAAKRTLKRKEGAAASGAPVMPRLDRIRYDELAADLRLHYQTTGRRNLNDVEKHLRRLGAFFSGWRAGAIDEIAMTQYIAARQAMPTKRGTPPAGGTINRELSLLGTLCRLAYRRRKLSHLPTIPRLREAAPRAGFFEGEQFTAIRPHLVPDLRLALDVAYYYGWRVVDEVLPLERRHLDLKAGTLRLDPGSTKTAGTTRQRDGRLVYLTPALAADFAAQLDRVRSLERQLGRVIPWLFPHLTGSQRQGTPRRDFRKAWEQACIAAGFYRTEVVPGGTTPGAPPTVRKIPTLIRHDFRRTAVRNLVNDGTPEKVAMTITGHKTRSVFDRYHIIAPEDLKAATARIAAREDAAGLKRSRKRGE